MADVPTIELRGELSDEAIQAIARLLLAAAASAESRSRSDDQISAQRPQDDGESVRPQVAPTGPVE